MNKLTFLCVWMGAWCLPACVWADHTAAISKTRACVEGQVTSERDGRVLPYADVAVKGTNIVTNTDITGHYTLRDLPVGNLVIEVKLVGYRTATQQVSTVGNATVQQDLVLTEDAIALDEVVVSANRSLTLRREAPALVSVLDKRLFTITQSMNMYQTLNFQPGVRTEDNCQNCGFSQVRINGLDGHYSQILIDSRPVFSSLNGVYGLEQIPTNMIERVEVVRGGGSSLYGASAIGGTINLITREPTRNTAELSHTLTSIEGKGAFDNNTTANLSLVTDDGKGGMYLYGQHHYRPGFDHDGDGYTELPNLKNSTIGLSSFYRFTPYSKLTLQYHSLNEFRRGGNKLHLTPHEANIAEQLEHDINGGNLTYDFFSPNGHHVWKSYFSFQHTTRKSYYGGTGEGATPADFENALKAYGRTRDFTYIAGTQYVLNVDRLLFMPAALTLGAEYNSDALRDEIIGYHHLLNQHVRISSGYVQNEWKNHTWSLLVGGRIDKHNLIRNAIFSPRANVRFNPNDNVNLRLSYADGFRAPQAFDEDLHTGLVGGERVVTRRAAGLKPERSHSLSLSGDFYHRFGTVQANLLVETFYTRLNHVFGLRQLNVKDPEGNAIQERYNADAARVYGLNIEGKVAFASAFQIQGGMTFQRSEYDRAVEWNEDAAPEKRMLRTPNVYGYFTASYAPVKHLSASFSGNYTGRMLVGHAAGSGVSAPVAVKTPDFLVLNLKVSYDVPLTALLTMQLNGGIQNLANAYQKDFDRGWNRDANYIYGPGMPRCYYVGVKFLY